MGNAGAPGRPAPVSVRLPASIAAAINAHAVAERPNEACGVILGSDEPELGGQPLRYEPCRNDAASPVRFRVHPDDVYRLGMAADDAGEVFWAIVHSHLRSPAVPSETDIEMASWWSSILHILVSLDPGQADPSAGAPSPRAWRIMDGIASEVVLELA
jgi:[CysO sulfur-carrier protein]-S-L-cysteine hydrolase